MKKLAVLAIVLLVPGAQLILPHGASAQATTTLTASPSVVQPGNQVTIQGSGFTTGTTGNNGTASVCFNPNVLATIVACQTVTVTNGTFSQSFNTSPNATPGATVQVTAQTGSSSGATTFTMAGNQSGASVSVNPVNPSPGQVFTVSGSGFGTNYNTVTVCFTPATATTNGGCQTVNLFSGSFSQQFTLSTSVAPGTQVQVSAQTATNTPVTQTFTVGNNNPTVSIPTTANNPGVTAGQSFTVTGSGWTAYTSVTVCLLTNTTTAPCQAITTDGSGNFSMAFTVPAGTPAGSYQLNAKYTNQSTSPVYSTSNVTVLQGAAFTISPTSVQAGGTFTVSGTNFNAGTASATVTNASGLTVATGSGTVSTTYGGTTGSVSFNVTIPAGTPPGSYNVTIQNNGATVGSAQTLTVSGVPTVTLSPTTTTGNNYVTVSGTGYPAGSTVNISTTVFLQGGGSQLVQTSAFASSTGAFSGTLLIPAGATTGTYTVTATSGTTSATALLQVNGPTPTPTNTPTPTPTPTNTPTPVPTDTPTPTNTPTPVPVKKMKFSWTSLWYPNVRVGTFNHLELKANQGGKISVHVMVIYPGSAFPLNYKEFTDKHGHWAKTFPVPGGAIRGNNTTAVITIRLQKGTRGVGRKLTFGLIR